MAGLEERTHQDGRILMRIQTDKPFEVFQRDTDRELRDTWASFAIRRRWANQVCTIESFGMEGLLKLEKGQIVAEARINDMIPNWLREKMLNDIRRSMKVVSQYSRAQEEEEESRRALRQAALDTLCDTHHRELWANEVLTLWQSRDRSSKLVVALTTGTGSATSLYFSAAGVSTLLPNLVAVLGAVIAAVQVVFKISDRLKIWIDIKSSLSRLSSDLETFRQHMDINPSFPVAEFRVRFDELRQRLTDCLGQWVDDTRAMKSLGVRAEGLMPQHLRRVRSRKRDPEVGGAAGEPAR